MSSLIRISPPIKALEVSRSLHSQSDLTGFPLFHCNSNSSVCKMGSVIPNYLAYSTKFHRIGGGNVRALTNYSEKGSVQGALDSMPVSVELEAISSESQFDRVIAEAQQLEESVVILWMARWCRKCIYLKPKLEKLAADYYPRIRFYCIDVNNVPHKLVVRAGITKMPTIQLWKDSKKLAEVIGGHKAYLVVNKVRDMIESEVTM